MKILKLLLAVLGVAGVIGAGVYTYLGWFELQKLVAVAESMRSAPQVNPQQEIMLAIGLALIGGLLLGLGLGIPRRSSGQIRKETLQAVNTGRESEIRQRATGHAPATETNRPVDPVDPDTRPRGGSDGNPR